VVSDVAQTQQSAPSHVGADVPAGRQMASDVPAFSIPTLRNGYASLPKAGAQCVSPDYS
jgi:hypothetical protein